MLPHPPLPVPAPVERDGRGRGVAEPQTLAGEHRGQGPKSPVIVVGTHIDLLPQAKRSETLSDLVKMYVQDSHRKYTYPCIYGQCQFINVNSPKYVDSFRDFVYDFAIQY